MKLSCGFHPIDRETTQDDVLIRIAGPFNPPETRTRPMNAYDHAELVTDLDLAAVYNAMVAAGAKVYLWTEDGLDTGTELVKLGRAFAIVV